MTLSWKWLVVAALLCLVAGAGLTSRYYRAEVETLERALVAAEADAKAIRAASAAKSAALERLDVHYKKMEKDLSDALQANPGWANERVPDAVFDSLFGTDSAGPSR